VKNSDTGRERAAVSAVVVANKARKIADSLRFFA